MKITTCCTKYDNTILRRNVHCRRRRRRHGLSFVSVLVLSRFAAEIRARAFYPLTILPNLRIVVFSSSSSSSSSHLLFFSSPTVSTLQITRYDGIH